MNHIFTFFFVPSKQISDEELMKMLSKGNQKAFDEIYVRYSEILFGYFMKMLARDKEKCGVVLGLENHWGLGLTSKGVMRIVNAIDSPWLSVTLDTGNFFDNRKKQLGLILRFGGCYP